MGAMKRLQYDMEMAEQDNMVIDAGCMPDSIWCAKHGRRYEPFGDHNLDETYLVCWSCEAEGVCSN